MDSTTQITIAIISGVVTLIGVIISVFVSTRNSNHKTELAKREISGEQRLLQEKLSREHSDITNTLGKGDTTIVGMLNAVSSKMTDAETEQKERYFKFSKKNKDIAKTLSDIDNFLKDWEALSNEVEQLRVEIRNTRDLDQELKASLSLAIIEIAKLKKENMKLKALLKAAESNIAMLTESDYHEAEDDNELER